MKYNTIQDVINYEIIPALGKFANGYTSEDIEELARRTFEYSDGAFTRIGDAVDFWNTVEVFDAEKDK